MRTYRLAVATTALLLAAPAIPTQARQPQVFSEQQTAVAASAQTMLGARPWVSLLCRFADVPDTPRQPEWFEEQLSTNNARLGHYWSEVSYGSMSISGSQVAGWYDLPLPRSSYGFPGGDHSDIDWQKLRNDCIEAADDDVHFPSFHGINVMVNSYAAANAGGTFPLTLDGEARVWGVTVMPAPAPPGNTAGGGAGWADLGILAHEMGHGMGFPHSSHSPTFDHDSFWDVMSNPFTGCRVEDPVYGCIPAHTIAQNKLDAGWIPEANVSTVVPGHTTTITLHPAGGLIPSSDALVALVPITGDPGTEGAEWLTIEARKKVGYDAALPLEGVIIHRMKLEFRPGGPHVGTVQDQDQNGDPNDHGAVWLPGETFSFGGSGITVIEKIGDTYRVQISSPVPNDDKSDAIPVTSSGLTFTEDTFAASASELDPLPSCGPGPLTHTVWFKLTPSARTFDISIATDGFPALIAIYEGGTLVACQTTDSTGKASISQSAQGLVAKDILVGSLGEDAGIITFSATEPPKIVTRTFDGLRLKRHLKIVGRLALSGAPEGCFTQKVAVEKKSKVGWKLTDTFTPKSDGTFGHKLADRPGTYRLRVEELRIDIFTCSAVTSKQLRHRHD